VFEALKSKEIPDCGISFLLHTPQISNKCSKIGKSSEKQGKISSCSQGKLEQGIAFFGFFMYSIAKWSKMEQKR